MNKILFCILLWLISFRVFPQSPAVNSFANSGGAVIFNAPSSSPAHIGVIGQPIATTFAGTLTNTSLMYSKDIHPPVVVYDPASLSLRLNAESTIQFRATDNNKIVSNKIFYRPIGKVGSFSSVDVTDPVNNNFTKTVVPAWFDVMGLEYYIEVKDKENTTRSPEGKSSYFAYVSHPAPQIPTTLLSYGKTKANYRIIAIPFATSSPIAQIFEELGSSIKSRYRIYRYKSGKWEEYPDFRTVDRGEGFFIIMSEALADVVLSMPELIAPSNNQSDPYKLSLVPGWNLIGNPYTVEMNWTDVLAYNNNPVEVSGNLKIWTESGQYANVDELAAYQGAFVWLDGSQPLLLSIPFKGQRTASGGRINDDKESDSWTVNFVLHENGEKNSLAAFGMNTNAAASFDRLDDLNPPALEKFPMVKFLHPEHSQHYFVRDFVPHQEMHMWQMEIPATGNGERNLDWSIPDLSSIPSDLFLYDMDRNAVVNMKTQSHYTFTSQVQNFKIVFGQNIEFNPERITVLPPFPNPVEQEQALAFSIGLPKSDQPYTIRLDFFDVTGRKIYDHEWNLPQGIHTLTLPAEKPLQPAIGDFIYYQLNVSHERFSGKLIYKL